MEIPEQLQHLKQIPKEILKIIRLYLSNNAFDMKIEMQNNEKIANYRSIKSCIPENYNYLNYLLNCNLSILLEEARSTGKVNLSKPYKVCLDCKLQYCIKFIVANFIDSINEYNNQTSEENKLNAIAVIDNILDKTEIEYEKKLDEEILNKIDICSLLYIAVLIQNDLIQFISYDENTKQAEFKFIELTQLGNFKYYINKLKDYYADEYFETLKLNIDEIDLSKNNDNIEDYNYFYRIASYFIYLQNIEKIDVVNSVLSYLEKRNNEKLRNRSKYFIKRNDIKVNDLPCTQKVKDKIKGLFNYILNYNFDKGVPYIPINIVMYTEDAELVNRIVSIIGDYMWFFGYLADNMKYYHKSMNELVMNRNDINRLYLEELNGKLVNKLGILTIDNFENVVFAKSPEQDIILNILAEKMEINNYRVCTVIYGQKDTIKSILYQCKKLDVTLFNFELEIDELSIDEVYELLIDKIELRQKLEDELKEKIYNYIKLTYGNSDVKNLEYVKVLYNKVMLKLFQEYDVEKSQILTLDTIPNVYNTRDLPVILGELNELIGLEKIKEQINNLVSLLKFNKNANIDITKFNLHMVFTGSPGTGKTTVARLLSDILYNLGYTKKNKLVEVSAKDLIAEYVGQTSGKTYSAMKSAFGGVLFIDEAYSIITESTNNSFSNDCISTILKVMEDQKDNIIVIFAGYKDEMKNFIKFNPGLESRIGYNITFDDYTIEELVDIYKQLLDKNGFKITDDGIEKIYKVIEISKKQENFGNARYVHKIYQDILIEHAKNNENESNKEKLMLITSEDINEEKLTVKDDSRRKIGF